MRHAPSVAYIGVGANLGDARGNVADALARLARLPGGALQAVSGLYRTAPIDAGGADYINAVARLTTTLSAAALLRALHDIEDAHGRERPYRNAPRTLDLDLLLYDAERIATPALQVPHPRMHQRAFVLAPLLELAPAIEIPGLGPARDYAAGVAGQAIARLD
ncbi:2-amino-4-hydroxy-6-hydroxymethyldihydropteridine diphosphokinase [Janthinobacterium sp.]|uniref:2-amino-4-hydroxy-6- hydroxymethyldihydropteridine diphosphokinase n=1 Tax=Janthinobacterium sp. TaxID=1871054 RepID=UPI00293D2220|nr:2-amino-4-hydroxy-6-hydroxymethyldihydropteridine diphosphokinase [Janthinobacterium sp.]